MHNAGDKKESKQPVTEVAPPADPPRGDNGKMTNVPNAASEDRSPGTKKIQGICTAIVAICTIIATYFIADFSRRGFMRFEILETAIYDNLAVKDAFLAPSRLESTVSTSSFVAYVEPGFRRNEQWFSLTCPRTPLAYDFRPRHMFANVNDAISGFELCVKGSECGKVSHLTTLSDGINGLSLDEGGLPEDVIRISKDDDIGYYWSRFKGVVFFLLIFVAGGIVVIYIATR